VSECVKTVRSSLEKGIKRVCLNLPVARFVHPLFTHLRKIERFVREERDSWSRKASDHCLSRIAQNSRTTDPGRFDYCKNWRICEYLKDF